MANYLRIIYHCHILQIHRVDLGQVVFLLLTTTQIYKNGHYEPCCAFHGAQYLPDLLHKCCQLPLEFIA